MSQGRQARAATLCVIFPNPLTKNDAVSFDQKLFLTGLLSDSLLNYRRMLSNFWPSSRAFVDRRFPMGQMEKPGL